MAVALNGAVIVDDSGPIIRFEEKCERCGSVQSRVRSTTSHALGDASSNLRSSFKCIKCGNHQDVVIRVGM
jgi:predicted nucleic-acid-binding Zn-ribbon protein